MDQRKTQQPTAPSEKENYLPDEATVVQVMTPSTDDDESGYESESDCIAEWEEREDCDLWDTACDSEAECLPIFDSLKCPLSKVRTKPLNVFLDGAESVILRSRCGTPS